MTSKSADSNDVMREHGPDELRRRADVAAVLNTHGGGLLSNGHTGSPDSHQLKNGRSQEASADDPSGEVTTEQVIDEISRLATLDPVKFERHRKKAAKRLGLRLPQLDSAVRAARGAKGDHSVGQGRALSLPDPVACDDFVNGGQLLDELTSSLHRYVVLGKHEARAIALWILHTYLFEIFTCTPRLAVTSPEKRCGKTTLMDVLTRLLPRVLSVAGITAAAIFRTVELARPTLLIDEADTFLHQNDELRGVLNSGHRRGGNMVRLVGDGHEPRQFSTFAPVAIAMIGKLPNTLADRSIPIRLRRRRPDEKVDSFRADRVGDLDRIASMAARWANDHESAVRDADPEMGGLFNRDADNWRPLFAIADAAGGHWPALTREAARALVSDGTADDESTGAILLADIRAAFDTKGRDRMSSEDLVTYLHGCEDRPWPEFGKGGKPISKVQLARLLSRFGIHPGNIRLPDGRTPKGYERKDLEDVFGRYIPLGTASGSATPPHT
jgi:putative DNA primase/helicase